MPTKVPASADMDDETFQKHLEARHIPEGDFADLTGFYPGKHFSGNRGAIEAYHTRLHETYEYDGHEHAEG